MKLKNMLVRLFFDCNKFEIRLPKLSLKCQSLYQAEKLTD